MGGDLFAPPAPCPPGRIMRMCMYKYAYMYGCICMHRRIDKQTVYVSSMYAHTVVGASISMCAYSQATIRRVLSFHLSTVHGMVLAMCAHVLLTMYAPARCYKLLQKEVTQSAHSSKSLLIYVHSNNAPKETHHASQATTPTPSAVRSRRVGSYQNCNYGGEVNESR